MKYRYDNEKKMKTVTDVDGKIYLYDYDDAGNLLEKTYPTGENVQYTYNK